MLAKDPHTKDFHHAHARNNSPGDEGTVYPTLAAASAANTGDDCYILHSDADPLWLVVCGKSPAGFGDTPSDLKNWFEHVTIKGRINKDNV